MKMKRSKFLGSARSRNAAFLLAGAAAALGVAALAVRQKTRHAEAQSPPRGRIVEVEGVHLHYLEREPVRGNGTTVILLHGNGNMADDYAISGLLDRLVSAGYRTIAFDRPGFGYSERPRDRAWGPEHQAYLLHHAMLKIGVEQAIVAAHSWGTLVALHMALQCPTAVQGLVLMSGYYYPTLRYDVPFASLPALPVVGTLLRHTLSPLLTRLAWPLLERRMFGPRPVHPRFADFPVWLGLRPGQLRAGAEESAMMVRAARSLCRRYRELHLPVALLAGTEDRHIDTRRQTQRLQQELLDSDLLLVDGAGHMLHYAAQRKIVAAVDDVAHRAGRFPAERQRLASSHAGQP